MSSLRHGVWGRADHGRWGVAAALLLLTGLLAACGGGGGGGSPPPMAATLTSIAVATATPSVAAGLTAQFTATGTYSDSTKKDISSTVTWASATTTVATINASTGLATSLAPGTSAITAMLSGVTGNGTLTVTAPTLVSIAVGPSNPSVAAGLTAQFTATGTYSDSTKKDISLTVTWASATTTVATINASTGLATSLAPGTSLITAMLSGVTGNDTLTVTAATLVSIAITPAKPTIPPGKTLQFSATGTYTDATTKDLTTSVAWGASPSSVATIGPSTGLASAIAVGTATITGTYAGGPAITSVPLVVNATVYAYASNFDAGTVSQYSILPGGALSALNPNTVAAGASPFSVSVELTGQYVYVANYNASTVSQYTIGAGGVLSPVGTTGSVMTGSHPNGVTIDPANKHAYVANYGDNTVSQYNIGTTGALTLMSTPTVPTGSFPASIVISPDSNYAYVANYACPAPGCTPTQGTISQYTVGADGALTPMSPAAVNTGTATSEPNSLIVDPTSKYLYVANSNDGTVSQFMIGAGGALAPLSPATVIAGIRPFSVTVDPLGRYVYVANTGSASGPAVQGTISQYSIGAGVGTLTPIGTGSVPAGLGVSSITVDPTGAYAYATNRGESSLSQYTIGVNGALTPMTAPTVAAGLHPTSIATGY